MDIYDRRGTYDTKIINESYNKISPLLFELELSSKINIPVYLNNICRLGLTELYKDDGFNFGQSIHQLFFESIRDKMKLSPNARQSPSTLTVTDFGQLFINVCVIDYSIKV